MSGIESVKCKKLHFCSGFWFLLASLGSLWRELARSLTDRLFRWASRFSEFVFRSLCLTGLLCLFEGTSLGVGWILSQTSPCLPPSLSWTEALFSGSGIFGLKSDGLVPSLSFADLVFWASRLNMPYTTGGPSRVFE